ncbi:hypothetical protein DFJ73DRAFT_117982 [Zopfochytrium polystomum]|nr:hypothetical protein DFJ73DRAFT_117982 [Zopfochytrium polystomum]
MQCDAGVLGSFNRYRLRTLTTQDHFLAPRAYCRTYRKHANQNRQDKHAADRAGDIHSGIALSASSVVAAALRVLRRPGRLRGRRRRRRAGRGAAGRRRGFCGGRCDDGGLRGGRVVGGGGRRLSAGGLGRRVGRRGRRGGGGWGRVRGGRGRLAAAAAAAAGGGRCGIGVDQVPAVRPGGGCSGGCGGAVLGLRGCFGARVRQRRGDLDGPVGVGEEAREEQVVGFRVWVWVCESGGGRQREDEEEKGSEENDGVRRPGE